MATWHTANFRDTTIGSLRVSGTAYTFVNSGDNPFLRFYSGAAPASPETAVTGTLLAAATPAPAWFTAPSSGVAAFAANRYSGAADATGTIGYARLSTNSSSMTFADLSVGIAGSGADVIVSSLSTTVGVVVTITNFAFKLPMSFGTVKLSSALANRLVQNWTDSQVHPAFANAAATLDVYSGTAPATADDAATGTLLWTVALSTTTWNAVAGGGMTLAAALAANAAATGTAGYARLVRGSYVIQGSVGTSGTDFIISTTSLVDTVSASITEATISLPAS